MNQRRPKIVPLIIIINMAVFVFWQSWLDWPFEPSMESLFLVSWNGVVEDGGFFSLLGSVFSHTLFFHFFVNMYVLFSFGGLIETLLGARRFIIFYLLAGLVSSVSHIAVSNYMMGAPDLSALGASGAVAGLVLLFSMMFPKEKLLIMGIIPVPAIFGALAFVGLDLWGLFAQSRGGGLPIGHGAHLGGAFFGAIYYFFYLRPKLIKMKSRMSRGIV